MSFPATILLLAGLVSAVLVPMFIGHGLAERDGGAILAGLGMGVIAAVLIFLFSRFVRGGGEERMPRAG
ncbi:MAG TPA: hypothetical protein VF188_09945 [Longimicrobiales bacterium]